MNHELDSLFFNSISWYFSTFFPLGFELISSRRNVIKEDENQKTSKKMKKKIKEKIIKGKREEKRIVANGKKEGKRKLYAATQNRGEFWCCNQGLEMNGIS